VRGCVGAWVFWVRGCLDVWVSGCVSGVRLHAVDIPLTSPRVASLCCSFDHLYEQAKAAQGRKQALAEKGHTECTFKPEIYTKPKKAAAAPAPRQGSVFDSLYKRVRGRARCILMF
jgi:hypothetical protein